MQLQGKKTVLLLLVLGSIVPAAQAQISVYISAPGSSTSGFTSTDVETFSSLSTGIKTTNFASPNYSVNTGITGTYQGSATNPFYVGPGTDAWSFGSNYFSVGAQSGSTATVSLQLSSTVKYFGIGWGAGDNNNRISFYKSGALLGTFDSSTIQTLLGNTTVTAVNGTTYNSSDYKGQPGNTSINSAENYAFVHFMVPTGTDKIDFFNTSTGSGFESDNHTIRLNAPTVTGSSLVFVSNIVVPEPGTLALVVLGVASLPLTRRRLRARS